MNESMNDLLARWLAQLACESTPPLSSSSSSSWRPDENALDQYLSRIPP